MNAAPIHFIAFLSFRFYKIIILLFSFSSPWICLAQTSDATESLVTKIDSLIEVNKSKMFNQDINTVINNNIDILRLSEDLPPKKRDSYMARAYNFQGIAYNKLKEFEKSVVFFDKAIAAAEKAKDPLTKAKAYNNKAIAYTYNNGDLNEVKEFYKEARNATREKYPSFENMMNINIAWINAKTGVYEEVKEYLDLAKEYTETQGNPMEKAYLYHLYGKYYSNQNDFEKAEKMLVKSIEIGEPNEVDEVPEMYYNYAVLLKKMNRPEEAFTVLQKHLELKNEEYSKLQLAQNEVANARFEVEYFQKEKEIAEEKMKSSRTFSIITVISLVILGVFFTVLWLLNQRKMLLTNRLEKQNQELKIANEKYLNASKQKSQFINTVSHELRTPLYGVIGITSLLLEDRKLSEQQTEYLNSLKFSGDYLLNLINDILLMSKIEVNKIEPIFENFDIKELAMNIVNSFRYQSDETENKIYLEMETNIPNIIYGDRLRLSQILINLLGNATKFTRNGDIWLRLKNWRQTENKIEIRFEVEDNGIGIPKDKQDEVFENFSQLDTKESAFKGTGLGLPIIKKLVEFYGGEIKLKSESGKGSLFWFDLSFDLVKQEQRTKDGKEKPLINVFNKKVLIVEDNKINQLVTRKTLENSNFICDIAENGKIALQKASENEYDIILMDLNMPVMNGIDATLAIREFDQSTPIVLLTASEMKKDDDLVKDIGIQEVLVKPYDTQHFFNVIIENLQSSSIK